MLPRSALRTLHLIMTKKHFDRGQVVCREGDPSDRIYIVVKGEFEISKVVEMNKKDKNNEEEKVSVKPDQVFL